MYIVESPSINPYINLAIEEYLFNTLKNDESCFMLWQNDKTVVVGNYQNVAEEVNEGFARQHSIRIARRLSGGGAVYHDLGNLNYTFITSETQINQIRFESFLQPLLQTLAFYGIKAEFTGRNDVTVEGKKICGNAQRIAHHRVLHHGCILLNSDPATMNSVLKPKRASFTSRSTKSERGRTADIASFLKKPLCVEEFKRRLIEEVEKKEKLIPYTFSREAVAEIIRLESEKYATWEWNYEKSPKYEMTRKKKFPGGLVTVNLLVEQGTIQKISFFGDFFANREIRELENAMEGLRLDDHLEEELEHIEAGSYINGVSSRDISELIKA